MWDKKGYNFSLERDGKTLLIQLTNGEDIGVNETVLLNQLDVLREDLIAIFQDILQLTVGKKQAVRIVPKFSKKAFEIHVKETATLDRLIQLFVKEQLLEKAVVNASKITCSIL